MDKLILCIQRVHCS